MKLKTIIIMGIIFVLIFFIYLTTIDKKVYYLNLGDNLAYYNNDNYSNNIQNYLENKKKLEKMIEFVNIDYRTTDLIRDIKNNKFIFVNNKKQTIKNALIKADLVTLSIGKNDIYYKLTSNSLDEIYDYVDEIILDIKELLEIVKEYCKEDIIFIGIIDYNTEYPEVIDYVNERLEHICKSQDINFININNALESDNINNNMLTKDGNKILIKNLEKTISKITLN